MSTVTLGLIQRKASPDPKINLRRAIESIEDAAHKGAQIICLQELFNTLYFCRNHDPKNFNLAEPISGSLTKTLAKVAKQKKVVIIAPFFEKRAQGIYHNSAVVLDADGSTAGHYRKMHIPDDPNFYEKYYFTPGDLGFQAIQTRYAKVGVLICWDQWFPEAARLTAMQGAQIIFYPTAIGHQDHEPEAAKAQYTGWEIVQRGHAVANEVFVAVTNRVGKEGPITFWGNSFVSDPFGSIVAQASESKEQTLIVKCDLSEIESTRQGWPFFRDRRVDAYGGITQRFIDQPPKVKKVGRRQ